MGKVTKLIRLSKFKDYSDLDPSVKEVIKDEVGAAVKSSILGYLNSTTSPVAGEGSFKALGKNYKKYKAAQGKGTSPNLELFGDMLKALDYKPHPLGVEVGIWNEEQAKKAELHNRFTAAAVRHANKMNVKERKFIPKKDESFKRDIEGQIKNIISEKLVEKDLKKLIAEKYKEEQGE